MTQATLSTAELIARDRRHIWHPYDSALTPSPVFPVASAHGVTLTLTDGRTLIDGMASWWSAIHGYNHPVLNAAARVQLEDMSHVMFGGLTHAPAVRLAETLARLTPAGLERVFFSDSGSVAVEVAIKMAVQYWQAQGRPDKHRLLALRGGYHGDTLGTMAVCDPVTGMHHLFTPVLQQQLFAERPVCRFGEACQPEHLQEIRTLLEQHAHTLAAVILEPIVQGAGGLHFYSADYLRQVRQLCDQHDVLLIADEIATGFGRTGAMFACDHAGITPDIMCVGKALTGGYLTLAATLCTNDVANGISSGEAGAFMHGPTFMGNPLACAIAEASIALLESGNWQQDIQRLQKGLENGLAPASEWPHVADVRTLGGIGVIELKEPVRLADVQPRFVEEGIWVRPFGRLVYVMPPYIMDDDTLARLIRGMCRVVRGLMP